MELTFENFCLQPNKASLRGRWQNFSKVNSLMNSLCDVTIELAFEKIFLPPNRASLRGKLENFSTVSLIVI